MDDEVFGTSNCRSTDATATEEMAQGWSIRRWAMVTHACRHTPGSGDFTTLCERVPAYVLDLWINDWRQRHAKGEVIIVRYADDFVIGFREEADARKCLAALQDRMTKFGLELHPDKTRLIEFGRYAEERRTKRGDRPPETFDFLGFTHISGKTRRGDFTIHRKTSRKKFQAKLTALKEQLFRKRHDDLAEVGAWLQSVFRGWCQYYAVPGNNDRLRQFRDAIQVTWRNVLRRRSQRGRNLTWEKFSKLSKRWLPTPRILHPYPNVRFSNRQHPR